MYSSSGARKSVDSLSPTLSAGTRGDFPFHGYGALCAAQLIGSAANLLKETIAEPTTWASAKGLDGKLHLLRGGLAGYIPQHRRRPRIRPKCDLYPAPTTDCAHRTPSPYIRAGFECPQTPDCQRHPSRYSHQHPCCRCIRVQAVFDPSRRPLRATPSSPGRR